MSTKLTGVTNLPNWINGHKPDFYTLVANQVVAHCIEEVSNLSEFNTFLDNSSVIPVDVEFNGSPTNVSIDKIELFNYASYKTTPIITTNLNAIGTSIAKSAITLPSLPNSCGRIYNGSFWGTHPTKNAVSTAAKDAYSAVYAEISNARKPFTGQIMSQVNGTLEPLLLSNYALAREQTKKFATLIVGNGSCANKNIIIYLIGKLTPNSTQPTSATIVSEPFFIP